MIKKQKLTAWEWEGLISKSNLADGHAHQSQNINHKKIINNLTNLFTKSEKKSQKILQCEFETYFFTKSGQHSYKNLLPPQYHYACSISIEIVANYLRLTNRSLTLIHPTFDNLADIFRRHKIKLFPIEESEIIKGESLKRISTDALLIVCPNNPTGQELTKKQFENIVNVCKKKKILLIVDFSFRLYSSFRLWDQYKILYEIGVDFIVLEDTGKTFPTLDLKLGILLSSKSVYSALQDITNDFILNVSPFIFVLLTEFIKTENNNKLSFQEIVDENRKKLIKVFTNTHFEVQNPSSNISIAWIKVPERIKSGDLCEWLEKKGTFILPGNPFFWNNPPLGDFYFRVAMARPTGFFAKTISKLAKECEEYLKVT